MSVSSIQSDMERVTREISDREKKLSSSYSKEATCTTRINDAQRSITKNTSASMVSSKLRQIESWNKDIATEKNEQAKLMKEIADRRLKLSTYQQQLFKAQSEEQKALFRKQEDQMRLQTAAIQRLRTHTTTAVPVQATALPDKEYDFFISYAHEDQDAIASPLCKALTAKGANVWFDETMLSIGDSLRKSIDHGLAHSRFGIVVLSKPYMTKFWTGQELNGLFQKWSGGDEKVILPIWHNISKDEVVGFSPTLADIVALKSADFTVEELAENLMQIVR